MTTNDYCEAVHQRILKESSLKAMLKEEECLDEAHVVIEAQDAYDDFYDLALDEDAEDFDDGFLDEDF